MIIWLRRIIFVQKLVCCQTWELMINKGKKLDEKIQNYYLSHNQRRKNKNEKSIENSSVWVVMSKDEKIFHSTNVRSEKSEEELKFNNYLSLYTASGPNENYSKADLNCGKFVKQLRYF